MNYRFSDKISSLQPSAIREILKMSSDPKVISFAAGNPAPEAFPTNQIAKITSDILGTQPIDALQYSLTEGYPILRQTLKEFVRENNGIGQEEDELIVVSGAQQGIELTCKILCNEGDTILCEDPSFIGSLNSFRSYNTNLVGVPMDENGMRMDALEDAIKKNPNTRFIYTIPNFQNPTGITMSLERRKELYEIAKKYGILILEDNPYGELRFSGEDVPTLKSMDTEGIVIYVGSFSKILSPGLRVGYLVAHKDIVAKVTVAKQCADVHTNILAQMICHRFMTQYDMPAHLQHLKQIYKHKCELMLTEMDKHFSKEVTYTRPEGGLFIWCTLPDSVNMVEFCKQSVAEYNVAVVPGSAFTAKEGIPTQSFRLNYSTPTDEQIIKGIEMLSRLTKTL